MGDCYWLNELRVTKIVRTYNDRSDLRALENFIISREIKRKFVYEQ